MFTSVADAQRSVAVEMELLGYLEEYLERETLRLNDLRRFFKKVKGQHSDIYQGQMSAMANPLVAYSLIKRLQSEWLNVVYSTEANENIQDFKASYEKEDHNLPKFEDLQGAAQALMRLQDVYALSVNGLANGRFQRFSFSEAVDIIKLNVSTSLSADDCYHVGKVAYEMEDYYHAILWLEEAAQLFREAPGTWNTEDEGSLESVLDYLAFSYFKVLQEVTLYNMGMLVLEVMTKLDHLPLGRVQINGIPKLSPTHSISGFYTVVSPTSEKLGEIQVSLALEPLSETYDSSSPVPTTDTSIDTVPAYFPKSLIGSSAANTPRGHVVSSGNLFKNLLESENNAANSNVLPLSNYPDKELPTDIENRAIHLLLGSVSSPTLNCWDENASPPDSISCASSIYNDCEPSNPLYDESLLEKLFYNLPSDTSGADLSSEGEAEQSVVLKHVGRKENPDELSEVSSKLKTARDQRSIISTKEAEPISSVDLTVDQLASLGQISLASTYFVEYRFPNTSSKGETGRAAMATEVTRAVSSKIVGGVVKFQHRSNYPVHFSGLVIEQWWNTDLEFKIFARKSTQKKPVPFGKAYFPLRDVMQSELLRSSSELTIVGLTEDSEKQHFGSLMVSVELNKESKDLQLVNSSTTGADKSKLCDASGAQQNEFLQVDYKKRQYTDGVTGYSTQPSSPKMQVHMDSPQIVNEEPRINVIQTTDTQKDYSLCQQVNYVCEEDETLFHVLLMVPEGKDFSSGSMKPYNVYLNCKFFGTEEVTRSPVIWGQSQPAFSFLQNDRKETSSREHVFEIKVEKVKGLIPLQSTVWGEADCYVQYYFPTQDPEMDSNILEAVHLHPYRTTTTLCVPDPVFNDCQTHCLVTPAEVPVQRLLLSACSRQGLSGGGAINFEVWCRYYYPNVREQVVARGILPLSKLCAMVTMQRHQNSGAQNFSLPLTPKIDSTDSHSHIQPTGLIDIFIQYKQVLKTDGQEKTGALSSRAVSVVVQVHRAMGLQAAARAIAERDHSFQYPADVGVNAYVEMQLSFLPESEKRTTRVVAKSFCPDFDHHVEFPCISGWFAVCLLHTNTSVESCLQNFGGGLEVSIGFTHHFDRERVIRVARSMGWNAGYSENDESDDCDLTEQALAIQIGIPRLWLPLHCLLLAGKRNLERSTYCYTRYKFYDKEAFNSSLRHPVNDDDEVTTVTFKDTQTVEVLRNQCFLWYLREEKLEIQVWVAFGKERRHRPHDTDRLIGSAYIDLSTLAKKPWKKQAISGVYPLFKRGASDLSGAAVRIHISLVPVGFTFIKEPPLPLKNSYVEDILDKEDEEGGIDTHFESDDSTDLQKNKTLIDSAESVSILKDDLKNTFAVNIIIERAMHLSLKGCPLIERSGVKPSCCVSCATADTLSLVSTPVIEGTDSPVWDYQQRTRLSKEILLDPHQCLVFKVWHKADVERVIGFASVDLSPLLSGFQSVCGWYNIIDFSGQCQGQIKVGITPQEPVHDLKEKRTATAETTEKVASFQVPSLSYQTSATYNSFPTHITRYPEQLINTSVRSGEASLSERKNLSELEDIQRYFNEKLSNTFPNFSNLDASAASGSEHNIQQLQSSHDPEGAELISKSAKLVSEMNSLISVSHYTGLNERSQGIIPEEHVASPPNSSGIFEIPVPLQSHNKENTLDVHLDLQTINNSENISNSASSSLVHEEEAEQNSPHEESLLLELEREEEPCTDEEYEEAVIQPITLNDVTALTDKTSPWSSLVSEPEHFAEQPEGAGEPFSEQNAATEGEQRSDTSPMLDSLDDENSDSPYSAIPTVTQGVNEADTVTAEDVESELPSVSFQPACNVEESNCSEIHVSFLDDDSDQSTKMYPF
ncbi:C2CD3 protein, partial [Polypterus senegalus]